MVCCFGYKPLKGFRAALIDLSAVQIWAQKKDNVICITSQVARPYQGLSVFIFKIFFGVSQGSICKCTTELVAIESTLH